MSVFSVSYRFGVDVVGEACVVMIKKGEGVGLSSYGKIIVFS
jgi:hypothetical protein